MSVRPNARALRSSRAAILSSLVPVYHQSAHFLPLASSQLVSAVNPILAPLDQNAWYVPDPRKLGPVLLEQSVAAANARLARNGKSLTELALISRGPAEYMAYSSTFNPDRPFHATWQAGIRSGREHPLVSRVRRTVDALHGTTAGGQAGVITIEELGEQAAVEAKQLREDHAREREEARRQEARDATLEAHYAEEELARA